MHENERKICCRYDIVGASVCNVCCRCDTFGADACNIQDYVADTIYTSWGWRVQHILRGLVVQYITHCDTEYRKLRHITVILLLYIMFCKVWPIIIVGGQAWGGVKTCWFVRHEPREIKIMGR